MATSTKRDRYSSLFKCLRFIHLNIQEPEANQELLGKPGNISLMESDNKYGRVSWERSLIGYHRGKEEGSTQVQIPMADYQYFASKVPAAFQKKRYVKLCKPFLDGSGKICS